MPISDRPLRLRHRDTVSVLQVRDLGAGQWLVQATADGSLRDEQIQLIKLPDGAVQCTLGGVARRVRVARVASSAGTCKPAPLTGGWKMCRCGQLPAPEPIKIRTN